MSTPEPGWRCHLYTRYEHLPANLQEYSKPFCELARELWSQRPLPGAQALPFDRLAQSAGVDVGLLLGCRDWTGAPDPEEGRATRDLLKRARIQAMYPGMWSDRRMVVRLVRTIIQAKDAWVRANLPDPALSGGTHGS